MDIGKLTTYLSGNKFPSYRLPQIYQAVFRDFAASWLEITTLPLALRQSLSSGLPFLSFSLQNLQSSSDQSAHKALLTLQDQLQIETVLLSPKPGLWTSCLSTQVGCAMGCTFCATGKMGLQRNLTAEEITDQVLFWQQYLHLHYPQNHLQNIVLMGMGEPFANLEQVFQALKEFLNPLTYHLGQRHLSVSTCGFLPGLDQLAMKYPQVNLAVSLHAPTDLLRNQLMPPNQSSPLSFLVISLKKYLSLTNRKIFIEYLLLNSINDSVSHAQELARLLGQIGPRSLLHVNLITCNPTGQQFKPSPKTVLYQFKQVLEDAGWPCTIRKSVGADISGACGQLATPALIH